MIYKDAMLLNMSTPYFYIHREKKSFLAGKIIEASKIKMYELKLIIK